MRYYEIVHRPKVQTATHQIAPDEKHVQRDAGPIRPSGGSLGCLVNAAKAKPHSAGAANHHAPVPHPGRYCCVQ